MRIAIIHLSDIHFSVEKQSSISTKLEKLCNALLGIEETVDSYILTITGDLTNTGNSSEFSILKVLLNNFVNKLRKELKKPVDVVCVPGNHDVNHSEEKGKCNISEVFKNGRYEDVISSQQRLLRNYNNFAGEYNCDFDNNKLVKSKLVGNDDLKIEFLLVNNATFSQKDGQNYKGLLYLSENDIERIKENCNADFTICLMHHNFDYYNDVVKHKAKKLFLQKSSFLLLGHEHEDESIEAISDDNTHTEICMTGAFCDGSESSLSVYVIDTFTNTCINYSLLWCKDGGGFYKRERIKSKEIKLKRYSDSFLTYKPEYLASLENTHKHKELGKLTDYYIFPRLVEENHTGEQSYFNEIKSNEELFKLLEDNHKIEIIGNSEVGKSSLLKYVFLQKDQRCLARFPLLFTAEDFLSSKPEKIMQKKIDELFNQSNDDSLMYYLQMNENDKLLLIDDFDVIEESRLSNFLQKYGDSFKYHIYSAKNSYLDLNHILKESVINDNIKFYRVSPFLSDKREELIQRVIEIKCPQEVDSIESISNSFSTNRSVLSATPSFVIMFCNFYFGFYGSKTNDTNLYSKVFESDITEKLKRIQTSKMPVDKLMTVLQKIAFFSFIEHRNNLYESEIKGIVLDYEREYITKIGYDNFISNIVKTPIMVRREDEFQFADSNVFAYFVAQEICSIDDNDQKKAVVIDIIKNSCYDINSSILLFVFHVQQDTQLLSIMIQEVLKYVNSWNDFSFDKQDLPAFISRKESIALNYDETKKDKYIKEEKMARLKKEEKIEYAENKETKRNYFENEDNDIESPYNKLLRACSLMYVLSKCLPIFEYKIKGDMKNSLANLIFSLPNKIFMAWMGLLNQTRESIIAKLKQLWITYHTDESIFPQDKYEFLIWWESLSLLINLYESSCGIATSENTKDFLLAYGNNESSDTMLIQKLIVCSRNSASPSLFYEIAKGLNNRTDEPAYTVIRRLVLYGILHIKGLEQAKARSLSKKFFGNNDSEIMKERMKIEQRTKHIRD